MFSNVDMNEIKNPSPDEMVKVPRPAKPQDQNVHVFNNSKKVRIYTPT
jgi:hypothetical protein